MAKSVFITGTGTDIGKTYVSALIVKNLLQKGLNTCYYKPALSGAEIIDGILYAGDAEYVKKISQLKEETSSIVSFAYQNPVSPHLASELENKPFSMEKVINDYKQIAEKYDYIVIEGAGGIICPFRRSDIFTKDIIKALNTNTVLVSNSKLGSINYTLLSIDYMKSNNIKVNGIIFNKYENTIVDNDNIKFIKEYTHTNILSIIKTNQLHIDIDTEILFRS